MGRSPAFLLSCAVILCVALGALTTVLAVRQPWLGLRLTAVDDRVQILETRGPSEEISTPARLLAVDGRSVTPLDLTPEPDVIETFEVMNAFRGGQRDLAAAIRGAQTELSIAEAAGAPRTVLVAAERTRPLSDLPLVFWVQVAAGSLCMLIGAWVWALKSDDWAARLFALSGLSVMLSTHSAAIYSTRELALEPGFFHVLSLINGAGAAGFGVAMICLFLTYPRPLVKARWFLAPVGISSVWWLVWAAEIAPVPTLSALHILVLMLGILVTLCVQIWATRKDPIGRAALMWLGLSVTVGAGAFVVSQSAPILLGFSSGLDQGYAFVFFLLIYGGLAFGLRRYRLFEMGEWAFRILFYTGAALAFLALDAVLIWALNMAPGNALGLAMIAIAFLYLPLRDVIWRRTVARRRVRDDELFESVLQTAFAASSAERSERWTKLLAHLFDPLGLEPADTAPAAPEASSDGLTLTVPATADAPALAVRFPWQGRGLFSPVQLRLARQLSELMRRADQNRDAFERGAAGERKRIARDLHDDVGARLLSGLHKANVDQTREVLREALADMRTIVGGLTGDALPLSRVVSDLRHEAGRRLEGAGIELDWPLGEADSDDTPLPYQVYKNWGSAHREIISNAIKHSGARTVSVSLARHGGDLLLTIRDDGRGLAEKQAGGNGLGNIERRMVELGGKIDYPGVDKGFCVRVTIPLSPRFDPALQPSGVHA